MEKDKKIAVLMGGKSGEREVSLRSGQAVYQALKASGLNVQAVILNGPDFLEELKTKNFDFAFLTLHGKGGEDGEIQTVLERLQIPYLGSDAKSSVTAFDKVLTKKVFLENNIPTPRFELLSSKDWQEKIPSVSFPVFLKPPDEGSSIDVFLAQTLQEALSCLPELFRSHSLILAEEKISGRELTVGIVGNQALPVVEIQPKRVFYDYVAKYTPGMTEYKVPAVLEESVRTCVQETALKAHVALGLRDFSRVDIILSEDGPYVLEANTIPGFTETSLLPKAAKAMGLSFSDLCNKLIQTSLTRVENEKKNQDKKIFIS